MQTFTAWLGQQEALFPDAMYGLIAAIRQVAISLDSDSTSPNEIWLRENAPVSADDLDDFVDFYECALIEYGFLNESMREDRRRVYDSPMQLHRIQQGDHQRIFDGFAARVSEHTSAESTGWLFFEHEATAYVFTRSARMAYHSLSSELRTAQRVSWYWPHEGELPHVPRQEAVVLLPQIIRHRDEYDIVRAYIQGLDPYESRFAPNQKAFYELTRLKEWVEP